MELILAHRRTLFLQLRAAVLFLLCAAATMRAAQSAGSAKTEAASRASATYQLGMSALQKGDLVSARADFEKVVRLAPNSPEGHKSVCWDCPAQGEVDSEILHFPHAVHMHPRFARASCTLC